MILQLAAAFVGTVTFALLFSVPARHYIPAGIVGTLGWGACYGLMSLGVSSLIALFFSTLLVVFFARYFAIVFQAPSTLFLIPGLFPLVPGAKIFWAAYYFMTGSSAEAVRDGAQALRDAFVIVLAIMVVLHLPGKLFKASVFRKRRNGKYEQEEAVPERKLK